MVRKIDARLDQISMDDISQTKTCHNAAQIVSQQFLGECWITSCCRISSKTFSALSNLPRLKLTNIFANLQNFGKFLAGSFSAVSKRNFARRYALESSRRDLHNALLCTALKSHFFLKMLEFCKNNCEIFQKHFRIQQFFFGKIL